MKLYSVCKTHTERMFTCVLRCPVESTVLVLDKLFANFTEGADGIRLNYGRFR